MAGYVGDYFSVGPDGKERFVSVKKPKVPKPADYVAVGPDGKERWIEAKKPKNKPSQGFTKVNLN